MIAVGLGVHTGWASAVVVEADGQGARVIDRRRLVLWDTGDDRFVFHLVAEIPLPDAELFVAHAQQHALACATREIGALVAEHRPARAAFVGRPGKALPKLAAILKVHALLHAAEGALYRDALAAACAVHDLRVVVPVPTDVAEVPRPAGPPWAREQQECARLAWAAVLLAE